MRWCIFSLVGGVMILASLPSWAVGPIRGPVVSPPSPGVSQPPSATSQSSAPSDMPASYQNIRTQYKKARQQSLDGITDMVRNPKTGITTLRAQRQLDQWVQQATRYLEKMSRDPKVQAALAKIRRQEMAEQWVREQMRHWAEFKRLVSRALEVQLEMQRKREAMAKAIKDAPSQIAALVAELKVAEDRFKEYLKGVGQRIDQRNQESARRLIMTVVGNVQHVWVKMIKAGEELLGKKENQPASYKMRISKITPPMAEYSQRPDVDESFKQSATQVQKAVKKSYDQYADTHTKATAARAPITSSSAAKRVGTFRNSAGAGVQAAKLSEHMEGRLAATIKASSRAGAAQDRSSTTKSTTIGDK